MSMGLDPSYWARIRDEGVLPDTDQIDKVVKKVGLRFEFFTDPTLGDAPDYRGFVGRRIDRDDTKGVPTVEGWLAMEAAAGRAVEPELVAHLRSFHARTGDIELEDVLALVRSWRARQADRRVIERPALETKIDEAKGQRRLEPAKKRGR